MWWRSWNIALQDVWPLFLLSLSSIPSSLFLCSPSPFSSFSPPLVLSPHFTFTPSPHSPVLLLLFPSHLFLHFLISFLLPHPPCSPPLHLSLLLLLSPLFLLSSPLLFLILFLIHHLFFLPLFLLFFSWFFPLFLFLLLLFLIPFSFSSFHLSPSSSSSSSFSSTPHSVLAKCSKHSKV